MVHFLRIPSSLTALNPSAAFIYYLVPKSMWGCNVQGNPWFRTERELRTHQEIVIKHKEIGLRFKSKRAFTGLFWWTLMAGYLTVCLRWLCIHFHEDQALKYHWESCNTAALWRAWASAAPGVSKPQIPKTIPPPLHHWVTGSVDDTKSGKLSPHFEKAHCGRHLKRCLWSPEPLSPQGEPT